IPPRFSADAVPPAEIAITNAVAAAAARIFNFISFPPEFLLVEPDVFHAPAVVDAVDHDRQTLDLGVPAVAATAEKDERLRVVLSQPPLDVPDDVLALLLV